MDSVSSVESGIEMRVEAAQHRFSELMNEFFGGVTSQESGSFLPHLDLGDETKNKQVLSDLIKSTLELTRAQMDQAADRRKNKTLKDTLKPNSGQKTQLDFDVLETMCERSLETIAGGRASKEALMELMGYLGGIQKDELQHQRTKKIENLSDRGLFGLLGKDLNEVARINKEFNPRLTWINQVLSWVGEKSENWIKNK